jgi:hypothetical protein
LALATEILGDASGNDDGLCESDEECLFSSNLGAYQGEGALSATCTNNTTLVNVGIHAYTTNGRN